MTDINNKFFLYKCKADFASNKTDPFSIVAAALLCVFAKKINIK